MSRHNVGVRYCVEHSGVANEDQALCDFAAGGKSCDFRELYYDVPRNDDINRIDIAEFRDDGYLAEVNRRVLHPLGLALEVEQDDDGTERLGGVWDYRDDAEGVAYADDYPELRQRVANVARLWAEREPARVEQLGFMVQPIGDVE